MSVGIRVTFESDGRCVTLERNGNGFLFDLVGDGQAFIPAADLAGALAFLDEVRQALQECERTYIALLGPAPASVTVQASTETPAAHPEQIPETTGNHPVGEPEPKRAYKGGPRGITEEQKAAIRELADLTAAEVAKRMGIPVSTAGYYLTKFRKARPSVGQLAELEAGAAEPAGFRANRNGRFSIDPTDQVDGNR